MKISKETISIIKAFSSMNNNLKFTKGNVIVTKNAKDGQAINTVIGRAVVPEEFPQDFCIYNLREFTSLIETFSSPEFEFFPDKNFVMISEGNYSIKYGFADPIGIIYPKKDSQEYDELIVEFFLSIDDIKKLRKAGNALSAPDLFIEGNLIGTKLRVCNAEQPSSSTYELSFPEKDSSKEFSYNIKMEHFTNIIPDSYNCKVVSFENRINFIVLDNGKGISFYLIPQA